MFFISRPFLIFCFVIFCTPLFADNGLALKSQLVFIAYEHKDQYQIDQASRLINQISDENTVVLLEGFENGKQIPCNQNTLHNMDGSSFQINIDSKLTCIGWDNTLEQSIRLTKNDEMDRLRKRIQDPNPLKDSENIIKLATEYIQYYTVKDYMGIKARNQSMIKTIDSYLDEGKRVVVMCGLLHVYRYQLELQEEGVALFKSVRPSDFQYDLRQYIQSKDPVILYPDYLDAYFKG